MTNNNMKRIEKMHMPRIQGRAVAFNSSLYHKNGHVSVRADEAEFYIGLLEPAKIKKGTHKTLGAFCVLTK